MKDNGGIKGAISTFVEVPHTLHLRYLVESIFVGNWTVQWLEVVSRWIGPVLPLPLALIHLGGVQALVGLGAI